MKYYVVADPHGFYEYLVKALKEKGFFEEENKKLIVCGDILDRGREAVKLVDFLCDLKEKSELIYITGNHEDLIVQALQAISRGEVFEIASGMSHHYQNGTWDTLLQLAEMSEKEAVSFPNELVRRVRQSRFYKELLPSSVDYYETEKHIFCHGWIPSYAEGYRPYARKYKYDPNWREASIDRWRMARWDNGMDLSCKFHVNEPSKTIGCGHWHASYGHSKFDKTSSEWGKNADFTPFYADGIIALDACTVESHMVNCIVITDNEIE